MANSPMIASYTFKEELAHGISHGLGTALSIAGLVFLLLAAYRYGTTWHIVSSVIYGSAMILLYASSTLYHLLPASNLKRIFQKLDHGMIYVLIAGTYTPFTLISLHGAWGWTLFGIVWGLAAVGFGLEIFLHRRIQWLSLSLYLGLGWLVIFAIRPMLAAVPTGGMLLLLGGGLLYTLGIIFYVWKTLLYHHAIWHLFVIGGSICHFAAIYSYVILPVG